MKSSRIVRPGEVIGRSGEYVEVGPRGGKHNEVTLVRGKTAPPTNTPKSHFALVRPAKNRAGKGH